MRTTRRALVIACAASAGSHAGLVRAHAPDSQTAAGLFAASALILLAIALVVERDGGRIAIATAALVLTALLGLYAVSRLTPMWPLDHVERLDVIGVVTKLFEAAGLLAALRLLQVPRTAATELPAIEKGVHP
jgi:hypothetical protein